jgi:hypothetical protein
MPGLELKNNKMKKLKDLNLQEKLLIASLLILLVATIFNLGNVQDSFVNAWKKLVSF